MYYLYCLIDVTANCTFGPVMMARNDAEMIRYFRDLIQDRKTLPGQHPQDFNLYLTASFDDHSGLITADEELTLISTGTQLLEELIAAAEHQQLTLNMERKP